MHKKKEKDVLVSQDVERWLQNLILRNAHIALLLHELPEEVNVALQLELYKQLEKTCKKVGFVPLNRLFKITPLGIATNTYVVYQCGFDEFVVGYFSSSSTDEILQKRFGLELSLWEDENVTPRAPEYVEDRIIEKLLLEVEMLPNFSTIISLGPQIRFAYKQEEKEYTIWSIKIEYLKESYDMEVDFNDNTIYIHYYPQKDKLDIEIEDGVTEQLAKTVLMELYNRKDEIEQLMNKILSSPIHKISMLLISVFILF